MGWLPERDLRVLVSYMPVSRAAAPSGAALRMVMSRARSPNSPSKQRYGVKEVYINYIGPVIGSHTGPNTMGLFFVGTER